MRLAGVDLAWRSEKNGSAIAFGVLDQGRLKLTEVEEGIRPLREVRQRLLQEPIRGIAVDGPLIVRNENGSRPCEQSIGKVYGSRKASCHSTNLRLYPKPAGVELSKQLEVEGVEHIVLDPDGQLPDKWQLECYPHPAIIEIFGLEERHAYKKGKVADRQRGQGELAEHIRSLRDSPVLPLEVEPENQRLDADYIDTLRGKDLKGNEDALDAIICLYIAGLYQMGIRKEVFGDRENGYVYVPTAD